MSPFKFKRGDLVSVWQRESSRHKWLLDYSIVRLLRVDEHKDGISVCVQTSESGKQHRSPHGRTVMQTGPSGFMLSATGLWQRELRKPVFL